MAEELTLEQKQAALNVKNAKYEISSLVRSTQNLIRSRGLALDVDVITEALDGDKTFQEFLTALDKLSKVAPAVIQVIRHT